MEWKLTMDFKSSRRNNLYIIKFLIWEGKSNVKNYVEIYIIINLSGIIESTRSGGGEI